LNFNKFSTLSTKAKMNWIQQKLQIPQNFKRDKTTVKAIMIFQKNNNIVANGVICEKTFNLLNGL